MVKIISFVSGKGGTGKTVITSTVGKLLAHENYRVLLIDWDFATRGLTSYLLPREEISNRGVIDILLSDDIYVSLNPVNIEDNLDLIPSVSLLRNAILYSDIVKFYNMIRDTDFNIINNLFKKIINDFGDKYDYIIFDTRSGIEILNLYPVFYSDWFIIISEEDRTSYRIASTLNDAIKNYSEYVGLKNVPIAKGFIINETTTKFTTNMINFLERDVFGLRCLAVLPFEVKIRRTFARDKDIIVNCKDTIFYNKLKKLALNDFEPEIIKESSFKNAIELISPDILTSLVVVLTSVLLLIFYTEFLDFFIKENNIISYILILIVILSYVNIAFIFIKKYLIKRL